MYPKQILSLGQLVGCNNINMLIYRINKAMSFGAGGHSIFHSASLENRMRNQCESKIASRLLQLLGKEGPFVSDDIVLLYGIVEVVVAIVSPKSKNPVPNSNHLMAESRDVHVRHTSPIVFIHIVYFCCYLRRLTKPMDATSHKNAQLRPGKAGTSVSGSRRLHVFGRCLVIWSSVGIELRRLQDDIPAYVL